jgi:hypothetical protein
MILLGVVLNACTVKHSSPRVSFVAVRLYFVIVLCIEKRRTSEDQILSTPKTKFPELPQCIKYFSSLATEAAILLVGALITYELLFRHVRNLGSQITNASYARVAYSFENTPGQALRQRVCSLI